MPRPRIPFSFLWQAPLRQRLWLGGVAVALFVGTCLIANSQLPPHRALNSDALGMDFIAFYTAGTFVREGRLDALYDLDAKRTYQHDLAATLGLDLGDAMGPWWNPPFYAWVFAPLSAIPFDNSRLAWMALNVGCVGVAMVILCRLLVADVRRRDRGWRNWGLIPLLTAASMPFISTLSHGQNTGVSLLLLTTTVWAWRAGHVILAGMVCGLMFYKPQLAAVVAAALVLSAGRSALIGLAYTGLMLLMVTLATLPGTLSAFVQRMPANLRHAQEALPYLWERHVTLKAFWRLVIQGGEAGAPSAAVTFLWTVGAATFACALFAIALRQSRAAYASDDRAPIDDTADELPAADQDPPRPIDPALLAVRRDRFIGLTILATPLIMPFYFDYDLLLLAVPAVLFGREMLVARLRRRGASIGSRERWAVRLWVGLFVWTLFNAPLTELTNVNGTVLILAALALISAARAWDLREPAAQFTEATADDASRLRVRVAA